MSPGSPFRDRAPTGHRRPPSGWGERGTVTLEAVLVYPLVLLIAWIGMQLTLVYLANRVALASAEEGASFARLGTGLLTGPSIRVVRTADTVTVQVSGQAQRIVPGFPIHVTQTVHSPTERFRGESRGLAP